MAESSEIVQKQGFFGTPQYTGLIVVGAVVLLILLRKAVIAG
jgi:hypothetical protein